MPSPKTRPRVFGQMESRSTETPIVDAETPSVDFKDELLLYFKDELPLLGEPLSTAPEAEFYTTVTLRLPQSLYDEYTKTAVSQDMSVEGVLQHRLAACKAHNALRGLWFSDSERSQLETLLKKWPLETATQALTLLSQIGVVDLDGLKLSLTVPQRKVLGIRTRYGATPQQVFENMLRREFQV